MLWFHILSEAKEPYRYGAYTQKQNPFVAEGVCIRTELNYFLSVG
jgi:hypothetical protein